MKFREKKVSAYVNAWSVTIPDPVRHRIRQKKDPIGFVHVHNMPKPTVTWQWTNRVGYKCTQYALLCDLKYDKKNFGKNRQKPLKNFFAIKKLIANLLKEVSDVKGNFSSRVKRKTKRGLYSYLHKNQVTLQVASFFKCTCYQTLLFSF